MIPDRFQVTSLFTTGKQRVLTNNYVPRGPCGGLTLSISWNGPWLATLQVENAIGAINVSSLFTGLNTAGGTGTGTLLYFIPNFLPMVFEINVTSLTANINVSASIS